MKVLLDQNLSPRLVSRIATLFSEVRHVRDVGLKDADDRAIWEYAKANGFTIFTRDDDFQKFSLVWGPPPKVVWLKDGNSSNVDLAQILTNRSERIRQFIEDEDPETGLLEVYRQFIIE